MRNKHLSISSTFIHFCWLEPEKDESCVARFFWWRFACRDFFYRTLVRFWVPVSIQNEIISIQLASPNPNTYWHRWFCLTHSVCFAISSPCLFAAKCDWIYRVRWYEISELFRWLCVLKEKNPAELSWFRSCSIFFYFSGLYVFCVLVICRKRNTTQLRSRFIWL